MVRFRLSAFFCFLLFLLSVGRLSRIGWLRGLAVNEIVRCVTRPGVGLRWGFSGGPVSCGGVRRPFSRVFDTPVDALFSNGSRGVREVPGCVIAGVRVN